jgi:hypothetical protein
MIGLLAAPADAEVGASTPSAQASAADAAWLSYAPPPPAPGIVCMVDSGVDPNPDTTEAVIGGQALSPATDTLDEVAALSPRVEPGAHPDGHGTLMAMIMAAPRNGWGMVGTAPTSVRVYNMKALPAGQVVFPAKEFYLAVEACQRLHESAYPTMTVVNLSLAGEPPSDGTVLSDFKRAVASAQKAGMSIVAAAGNSGGSILFPASYGPILAIGATDASQAPGTPCAFSSRGEGLDLLAPGCDTVTGGLEAAFEDTGEPAFGSGDSQSAAEVAAVEASLDSYAPQLTPLRTEACVTSSTQNGQLDVAAAFDACGLHGIVQVGKEAEPSPQQPPIISSAALEPPHNPCSGACLTGSARIARPRGFEAHCPRPHLHTTSVGTRVHLKAGKIPSNCSLQARVGSIVDRIMHWKRKYTTRSASLVLKANASEVIEVRLRGRPDVELSSSWTRVARGH